MKKLVIVVVVILFLFFLPFLYREKTEECEYFIEVEGEKEPLSLEEYVKGVISAEMPVVYDLEALKAQAIAARTYVLKSTNYGQIPIEASTRKQVFKNEQQREEGWKENTKEYEAKLEKAVKETKGQILTFNDELITAMFHASSNGQTESAENYGGTAYPYLQSVSSPEEAITTVSFTIAELNEKLSSSFTVQQWANAEMIKNSSGRVETLKVGNKQWSGREVRTLLELKSTDFRIGIKEGNIIFTMSGYGHGVGMSQVGANELAKKGSNAEDILAHYYKGTTLNKLNCTKNE